MQTIDVNVRPGIYSRWQLHNGHMHRIEGFCRGQQLQTLIRNYYIYLYKEKKGIDADEFDPARDRPAANAL